MQRHFIRAGLAIPSAMRPSGESIICVWGQSLLHTGYKREAKEQLDKARSLRLSVSDRAQLDALLQEVAHGSNAFLQRWSFPIAMIRAAGPCAPSASSFENQGDERARTPSVPRLLAGLDTPGATIAAVAMGIRATWVGVTGGSGG